MLDVRDDRGDPGPDFLDYLDGLDDIDPYEDEEKFVPLFQKEWVKVVALIVAVTMFVLAGYSGLRILFH